MKQMKDELMKEARAKGICADGYSIMRTRDRDMLIEYYIENPDWCLERDFPSLDTLKEHFFDLEDRGIFIGKTFHGELLNEKQAYIFHNCKGTVKVGLNVDRAIIPMLYVANHCRLRFVGKSDIRPQNEGQRIVVPLYVFGANDISAKDNVYVMFNRYTEEMI